MKEQMLDAKVEKYFSSEKCQLKYKFFNVLLAEQASNKDFVKMITGRRISLLTCLLGGKIIFK